MPLRIGTRNFAFYTGVKSVFVFVLQLGFSYMVPLLILVPLLAISE